MDSKKTTFETVLFLALLLLITFVEYFANDSSSFLFVLILLLETMGIIIYSYRKFTLFKEYEYTYFLIVYALFGIFISNVLYRISNSITFEYNYLYMIKLIDISIIIFAALVFRKSKKILKQFMFFMMLNVGIYILSYMTDTGFLLLILLYLEVYIILKNLKTEMLGNRYLKRSIQFKIMAEIFLVMKIIMETRILEIMNKAIYIYSFYIFIKYLEKTISTKYYKQLIRKERNFENILQEFDYGVIKLLDYRIKDINEKGLKLFNLRNRNNFINKYIEEVSEGINTKLIDKLVRTGEQEKINCKNKCIGLNAYLVNDLENNYIVLVLQDLISSDVFFKINEKYEDIIYLKEENSGYQYINPAIKRVLGYTQEEFYKNTEIQKDIVYNDELKKLLDTQNKVIKTQTSKGKIVWLMEKEVELKIGDKKYKYLMATDVTEFKDKEKDLEVKIAELERNRQREGKTISVVSHEMRTPITSMVGFIESILLNSKNIDEKYVKYMEKIYKNSMRLKALIDNVLNFNKLLEGKLEVDRESVNLNKVLDEIILNNKILSSLKNINNLNNLNEDIYINIDELMLYQILNNITSNAIKYNSENGKIIFDYKKKKDYVILKISDTGIGIKKEDRSKIFKEYERIKGTSEKGTGLGLALTKKMIEMNKGKIWFTSEYNKGTTMYLEFERSKDDI